MDEALSRHDHTFVPYMEFAWIRFFRLSQDSPNALLMDSARVGVGLLVVDGGLLDVL